MDKDAFWFLHYSNKKDEPYITLLIEQLGLEGYGIFWVIWETLRDQPGYSYPVQLIPSLARKYNTTYEKMNQVIRGYKLFTIEDNNVFYSPELNEIMENYDNNREKRRLAGRESARKRSTYVKQLSNDGSTMIVHDITLYDSTIDNIIKYLNEKTGKNFSTCESNVKFIRGRLSEGRTEENCKYVIDVKCSDWKGNPEMDQYLCPQTLFRPGNYERYLNQKIIKKACNMTLSEMAEYQKEHPDWNPDK